MWVSLAHKPSILTETQSECTAPVPVAKVLSVLIGDDLICKCHGLRHLKDR